MRPPALRSDRLCRFCCICVSNGDLEYLAAEVQRSLFSWEEFMAPELVRTRGAQPQASAATISMSERALSMEEEWEAEPVGSGR